MGPVHPPPMFWMFWVKEKESQKEEKPAEQATKKRTSPFTQGLVRHLEYLQKDCNYSIEQNKLLQIRIVSHTFDIGRFNNVVGFVTSR